MLRAFTLKNAARQVDNPELAKVGNKRGHLIIDGDSSAAFGPFFWVVLSVASVLVSASVVLALVIRTRCFMGRSGGGGGGGGEAVAAIRRGERRMRMAPFENSNKRRRSSSSTMRFPRHEMEMGGGRGGEREREQSLTYLHHVRDGPRGEIEIGHTLTTRSTHVRGLSYCTHSGEFHDCK